MQINYPEAIKAFHRVISDTHSLAIANSREAVEAIVKAAMKREGPRANPDGSLTLDNASVQRLMDYGLLHFTDTGWIVGKWDDAVRAQQGKPR